MTPPVNQAFHSPRHSQVFAAVSTPEPTEFEKKAQEKPLTFWQEFWLFLREEKQWWLAPILVALLLLGLLVVLSGTGAAPFIYTLF